MTTKIKHLALLLVTTIISGMSPVVIATEIHTTPDTVYLANAHPPRRYSSLGDLISDLNGAASISFDLCTSAPTYDCWRETIVNAVPRPGQNFANGEPWVYRLHLESYHERKTTISVWSETWTHRIWSADVQHNCPPGFFAVWEGPPENVTITCKMLEETQNTCPSVGNPINVATGRKFEIEIDYQTADGLLKIERRYIDQTKGWSLDTPGNLEFVPPGEEIPLQFGEIPCIIETRYRFNTDSGEDPYFVPPEPYLYKACQKLINQHTEPIVHLWIGGIRNRFVKSGNAWLGDGVTGLKTRLEETDPATNEGAAWQFTARNGDTYYFLGSGELLRRHFVSGGYLEYQYNPAGLITAKTDHLGRSLTYHYDAHDRIDRITQPDGEEVRYTYASNDPEIVEFLWLKKVAWPDGSSEQYLYNEPEYLSGNNSLLTLTGKLDSSGNRIGNYQYASDMATATEGALGTNKRTMSRSGLSVTVTDGLDSDRTYQFQQLPDGTRLLTGTNQPAGSGCAASTQSAQYYADGLRKSLVDFNGSKTLYDYDHDRGLETVRVEGLNQFDANDYLSDYAVLPPGARKTTTQWHPLWREPASRAEPGRRTTYIYHGDPDPFNNNQIADCVASATGDPKPILCSMVQEATIDPNGEQGLAAELDAGTLSREWHYTYNEHGQTLTTTRSSTHTDFTFQYYPETTANWTKGDLQSVTNALGHTTVFNAYNRNGYPLSITDANGVPTELTYDARDRLTQEIIDGETITLHEYDLEGNRIASVLPNGVRVDYHYDQARRLIGIQDSAGNLMDYQWDSEGNLTREEITDVNGTLTYTRQHIYDALSRVMQTIEADGDDEDYFYDPNGNLIGLTNARDYVTAHGYDPHNNLGITTDALNGKTKFTYDGQHRITRVEDPKGSVFEYQYDGMGNQIQQNSPDTGESTFTHDERGNILSRTDARGVITNYTYDALNRLMDVSYPANPNENATYFYDSTTDGNYGIGRLTQITDESGEIHFVYDHRGNVIAKNYTIEDTEYSLHYAYDLADNLTQITYPSGRIVQYTLDSEGRISGITTQKNANAELESVISNVSYLPFGPIESFAYGNGVTQTISYDTDYRITDITTSGDEPILNKAYGYDANDNILSIADANNVNLSQSFAYDPLDRVEQAEGSYGQFDYQYDEVGNRLQRTQDQDADITTENYDYEADSNRLTRVITEYNGVIGTEHLYTCDETGNIVQEAIPKGVISESSYNDGNRLSMVEKGTSTAANYLYNALGQRVMKSTGNPLVTRHFHYDESGLTLAETTGSGEHVQEFIYLGSLPIASYKIHQQSLPNNSEQLHFQGPDYYTEQEGQLDVDLSLKQIQLQEPNQDLLTITFSDNNWTDTQSGNQREIRFQQTSADNTYIYGSVDINLNQPSRAYLYRYNPPPRYSSYQQLTVTGDDHYTDTTSIPGNTLELSMDSQNKQITVAETSYLTASFTIADQYWREWGDNAYQITSFQYREGDVFLLGYILSLQSNTFGYLHIEEGQPKQSYYTMFEQQSNVGFIEAQYYIHGDHLGTPQVMTDKDQKVVWKAEYAPFGEATVDEDADGDGVTVGMPLRFPGQYFDKETGLHYNYFRDYDPSLGRYVQSDPIGLDGGLNTYGYVGSNPINRSDFFGLKFMGIPRNEQEAREMYPGTRPLSECERCKIKAQPLCFFTGFGMGRLGLVTGSAIGSAVPLFGTAAGGIAGSIGGFIGGMAVCQQIKNNACKSECEEEEECE